MWTNRLADIYRLDSETGCGLWRAYLKLSLYEGGYDYEDVACMLKALASSEPGAARQALGLNRGDIAGAPKAGEHRWLKYLELVPPESASRLWFVTRTRTPRSVADELRWGSELLPAILEPQVLYHLERELVYGSYKVETQCELRRVLDELARWSIQFDIDWELQFRNQIGYLCSTSPTEAAARELEQNARLPKGDPPFNVVPLPLANIESAPSKSAHIVSQVVHEYFETEGDDSGGWLVDIRDIHDVPSDEPGMALEELLRTWNQEAPRVRISRDDAMRKLVRGLSGGESWPDDSAERECASAFLLSFGGQALFWEIDEAFAGTGYDATKTIGAEGAGLVGFIMTTETSD